MIWKHKIRLLYALIYFNVIGITNAGTDPGLKFIENKNQWPSPIHFSAKMPGGNIFLQPGRFSYYVFDAQKLHDIHEQNHTNSEVNQSYSDNSIREHLLFVDFIGSNKDAIPQPIGMLPTYYNYFIGGDSNKWAHGANSYTGVLYQDFYEGIDLKIYSVNENFKYDYIVAPLGDPTKILVRYSGADNIYLDNGNLFLKTSLGDIIEKRPYAYQIINGKKVEVVCKYVLQGKQVSFHFPDGYDACYELTIDPVLIFSTYSGSSADNWGSTATPGEGGKLYSAGVTNPSRGGGAFPVRGGPFQTAYAGMYDIGILKYDSAGKTLLYASYLGGDDSESPHSLVMNSNEELIVFGTTSSYNFPTTTGVIDRTFNGGTLVAHVVMYTNGSDMFVARISKDGKSLLSSTYLGGSNNDGLNPIEGGLVRNYGDQLRGDVITDELGNIYISSVTSSSDFPVTKGLDTLYNNGGTDAVLVKLNRELTNIIWGTFLGGDGADASHTLKLDKDKNVFIAGGTNSTDFPVTDEGYQTTNAGEEDGWIGKIKNDGKEIISATYTGTSEFDQIYFLDINEDEDVYVYGQTAGNFPVTTNSFKPGSGQFLQKFKNDLSSSIFSTVFGSGSGIPDISPTAFLVNECNNIIMAGWGGDINSNLGYWPSSTHGMLTSEDAYQSTTSGSDFYFIVLTEDASQLLYATYLGGSDSKTHVDGGTSRFDKGGIVYHAVCSGCEYLNETGHSTSDFPTTDGAWSATNNSTNCNNAAFKFDLSTLKARLQTNTTIFDMPGFNRVCMPNLIVFENKSIGGKKYEWDMGDGTTKLLLDTNYFEYEYGAIGDYVVKLKAIDEGTCIGTDIASTVVHVYEPRVTIQDDQALCFGTPFSLQAYNSDNNSHNDYFNWTTNNNSFESHDFNYTHIVNPPETTEYYVTITEGEGCIHKESVQLTVIPNVELDFEFKRPTDCFSRPTIELRTTLKSEDADQIFYDFGDGQTSDADEVEHTYTSDNTYHVKLVGTREFCVYEKGIDVPIYTIKVPNVITPAQKEKNDTFTIQYGDVAGATPANYGLKVSVVIYNRWGRPVYESEDYKYDWAAEGLAGGVYFYDVEIEGRSSCKSWIHVIK